MLLNSIEMINAEAIWSDRADWQLIELSEEVFLPCEIPFVVPLNDCDIAILGGYDSNGLEKSKVLVFNVLSKVCHKVFDLGDSKL